MDWTVKPLVSPPLRKKIVQTLFLLAFGLQRWKNAVESSVPRPKCCEQPWHAYDRSKHHCASPHT